jgi:hypothetical protein
MNQNEKTFRGASYNQYQKCHAWIYSHYGKATKCENDNCNFKYPKRYEWALRDGRTYSKNVDDYIQLCTSCHRKYDFSESTRQKYINNTTCEAHNRAKFKNADVLEIVDLLNNGESITDVSNKFNVSEAAILDIKIGRNWSKLTGIKYYKFLSL